MIKKILVIVMSLTTIFVFILSIGQNRKAKTDFEVSGSQWALNNYGQTIKGSKGIEGVDINISKAWDITMGSPDVLVAVVDTGVYISDEGLSKAINTQKSKSWDFYYNDNTIYDAYIQDYHGTYIANAIAGYDSKKKIYGVAPNISLLPVKFLRGTTGNSSDAVEAIKYACDMGAQIVNCSWNFNSYNEELYRVIASYPEVLFVNAAGNSNINLDKQDIFPASYDLDNIISVLAVDNCGKVYTSSGRGMNVDIAAPGVNIMAKFPEGDVTYVSGTSIASAYVSGVAALMRSIDNSLTPKEIISTMINTAKKNDGLEGMCLSSGIIDAYECVKKVGQKRVGN